MEDTTALDDWEEVQGQWKEARSMLINVCYLETTEDEEGVM